MRAETFVRHLGDSGATVERLADGDLLVTESGRRVAVRLLDAPITATAVVDAYVRALSTGVAPGLAGAIQGDARRWADRFGVRLFDIPEEPVEAFDLSPLGAAARAAAALDAALAANVAVHPAEEFTIEPADLPEPIPLFAAVEPMPLLAPVPDAAEAAPAPMPELIPEPAFETPAVLEAAEPFTLVSEAVFDAPPAVAAAPVDAVAALGDLVHTTPWEEVADAALAGVAAADDVADDDADAPAPTLAEVLFETGAAPVLEALPDFPDRAFDPAETLALVEALEAGEPPVALAPLGMDAPAVGATEPETVPAPVAPEPRVAAAPVAVAFEPDDAAIATLLGEAAPPARPAAPPPAYDALVALVGEARLPPRRVRALAAAPDVVLALFGEAKRPQPGPRFASEPAALVALLGAASPPPRARPPPAPEALVALYGAAKPALATPRVRFPEPAAETLVTLLGPARRPHPVRRVQFPAARAERLGDLFGEATPPETRWTLPWAPRPSLPWDAPRAAVLVAAGSGATETAPTAERFWASVARGAPPTEWLAGFKPRPQV